VTVARSWGERNTSCPPLRRRTEALALPQVDQSRGPSAPRVATQYLCPTWRPVVRQLEVASRSSLHNVPSRGPFTARRTTAWDRAVPLQDVATRDSVVSLLDVASLGLSARQRGITQSLCSAFDRSTSRSLADVNCHHFPRHNTLSNISDQVIYIHDVEGETGRSIADRPRTSIRVIAGTNAGGRSIGVAVCAKCQTVVSSATHGAAFHAVFAVL